MTPILATPTAADAAPLGALFRRSFTDTFGHLYGADDLAAFLDRLSDDSWARELADADFAFQVARAADALVGFAKLAPVKLPVTPSGPAIELRQFYLRADQQGSGLAQRLMDWVIAEARRRGAGELFLSVFVDNPRARRFYERYGFTRVGSYAFMVGNHRDEDDLMRLAL